MLVKCFVIFSTDPATKCICR